MAQVRVFNKGYDVETGIGEMLHTTSVRHAFGMIRRGGVAVPVELAFLEDRIVPTVLELTRELSGAWVEGIAPAPSASPTAPSMSATAGPARTAGARSRRPRRAMRCSRRWTMCCRPRGAESPHG